MKTGHKIAALSCLAAGVGAAAFWRWQLQKEIVEMEQRLQESQQYIGQPKEQLEVQFSGKSDWLQ